VICNEQENIEKIIISNVCRRHQPDIAGYWWLPVV
jgi:hypothetical protein